MTVHTCHVVCVNIITHLPLLRLVEELFRKSSSQHLYLVELVLLQFCNLLLKISLACIRR